jgi:hypothetical protein
MKSAGQAGMSPEDFQARVQQLTGKTYASPMEMQSDLTSMQPDMLYLLGQRVFNPKTTPLLCPLNTTSMFFPRFPALTLTLLLGFHTNRRK